jgi:predicted ATP-grasp superfamily ATP-dependent carboligase
MAIPAVVVGSGLGALGALRLLSRAGIPVYALSAEPSHESGSRWYRPLRRGCESLAAGASLAQALEATSLEQAVLIPAGDSMLTAVATLPEPIAARFPSSTPSASAACQLTSKAKFALLLETLGAPCPRTLVLDERADLEEFLATTHSRDLFLKPDHSANFIRHYNAKACRVRNLADARARLARFRADGHEVVVQEYLPGPASNHFLIDGFAASNGAIRALFARRRLRMYPVDFGDSTHMVSVPLSQVQPAVETLRSVLGAIGYRGIFSAEFKRDARDGRLKILEVNARLWIFVEFAGRCGVDVCTMAYRDALGMSLPESMEYRIGARLVSPYLDLVGAHDAWSQGQLRKRAWLRSWLGAQQPHFNWTDPLPAIREWHDISTRMLRMARRRVRQAAWAN